LLGGNRCNSASFQALALGPFARFKLVDLWFKVIGFFNCPSDDHFDDFGLSLG
jgi:hypothetical protein